MNVSKNKLQPKYICDKCKKEILYVNKKGFKIHKYYKYEKYNSCPKKDFDLCEDCEKEFRNWLNTPKIIDVSNPNKIISFLERWR